jgi:hypothetical protein
VTAIARAFRARLYAPRSVDLTETTVLSPRAGSVHADPFQVATIQGVAGYQPYMWPPTGRRGRIDFLTMNTDSGEFSFDVTDQTVGGNRLTRWATAFLGDANARDQLKSGIVQVDQQTTSGGAWSRYRTGRVTGITRSGEGKYTITCRGNAALFNRRCFVGTPASSVAYARMAPLYPFAITAAWGALEAKKPIAAVVAAGSGAYGQIFNITENTTSDRYGIFTAALVDLCQGWSTDLRLLGLNVRTFTWPNARVKVSVTRLDTMATGLMWLRWAQAARNRDGHWSPKTLYLEPVNAGSFPTPPNTTSCTLYAFHEGPPREGSGLLIGNVHIAQYMADLLDGKFGPLDASGAALKGIPRDAAAWATLIADPTLPTVRGIEESTQKLGEVLKKLSRFSLIALGEDEQGRIFPIDMRRKAALATVQTITDDDLVASASGPGWRTSEDDALTEVRLTYADDRFLPWRLPHEDRAEFPAVPSGLIESAARILRIFPTNGNRAADLEEKPLELDASYIRTATAEVIAAVARVATRVQEARLERVAREYEGPFADGAMRISMDCRQTVAARKHGDPLTFTLSRIPNRATGQMSGAQLGRIMEVQEQPNGVIRLEVLHLGAGSQSVSPVGGALALDATVPKHRVVVPITMNAAAEPVALAIAVTATSVAVRPVESDGAWVPAGTVIGAASTLVNTTVVDLPAGMRIWVRFRAEVFDRDALKLPSAWVFPSGTGYIDTTALTAPSALATSGTVNSTTALITWTNGEPTLATEILIVTGAVAPTPWTEADRIDVAGPSDTRFMLRGLDGPTANHVVGIRHRDPYGGVSTVATLALASGATQAAAPAPRGLQVLVL